MIEQEKQTNFFSTKKGEGSVFPFPDLGLIQVKGNDIKFGKEKKL